LFCARGIANQANGRTVQAADRRRNQKTTARTLNPLTAGNQANAANQQNGNREREREPPGNGNKSRTRAAGSRFVLRPWNGQPGERADGSGGRSPPQPENNRQP